MWKDLGEWMAALLLTACIGVSVFGAAEWINGPAQSQAVQPVSGNGITVVVDPGHGGFDGGAVGAGTGVQESGLNLTVAKLLADALSESGMQVILTRQDEEALAANKQSDLAARKAIFNQKDVDLVVSVHMNKYTDPSISGAMAYYMAGSTEGQKLAQCVIDAVCDGIGRNRRLANPGDYFVIRECACPAVLVECGFLSNTEEEKKLMDPAYQRTLATSIATGISAYLSGNPSAAGN